MHTIGLVRWEDGRWEGMPACPVWHMGREVAGISWGPRVELEGCGSGGRQYRDGGRSGEKIGCRAEGGSTLQRDHRGRNAGPVGGGAGDTQGDTTPRLVAPDQRYTIELL